MFYGQYLTLSIEYSLGSTEQYTSNILWTIFRNVICMLTALRSIHLLWTVLPYIHYMTWTILCNVHSKHVENENFMSSKAWIHDDCR